MNKRRPTRYDEDGSAERESQEAELHNMEVEASGAKTKCNALLLN